MARCRRCPVMSTIHAMDYVPVDRPCPRLRDSLSIDHCGIVVFSTARVRMSVLPFNIARQLSSCCASESILVARPRFCSSSVIRAHRQSNNVSTTNLSTVLERAATYSAPVHLVGDFNIRLNRPDDPQTQHSVTPAGMWHS